MHPQLTTFVLDPEEETAAASRDGAKATSGSHLMMVNVLTYADDSFNFPS